MSVRRRHSLLSDDSLTSGGGKIVYFPDLKRLGIDPPAFRRRYVPHWLYIVYVHCFPRNKLFLNIAGAARPLIIDSGVCEEGNEKKAFCCAQH